MKQYESHVEYVPDDIVNAPDEAEGISRMVSYLDEKGKQGWRLSLGFEGDNRHIAVFYREIEPEI